MKKTITLLALAGLSLASMEDFADNVLPYVKGDSVVRPGTRQPHVRHTPVHKPLPYPTDVKNNPPPNSIYQNPQNTRGKLQEKKNLDPSANQHLHPSIHRKAAEESKKRKLGDHACKPPARTHLYPKEKAPNAGGPGSMIGGGLAWATAPPPLEYDLPDPLDLAYPRTPEKTGSGHDSPGYFHFSKGYWEKMDHINKLIADTYSIEELESLFEFLKANPNAFELTWDDAWTKWNQSPKKPAKSESYGDIYIVRELETFFDYMKTHQNTTKMTFGKAWEGWYSSVRQDSKASDNTLFHLGTLLKESTQPSDHNSHKNATKAAKSKEIKKFLSF